MATVRRSGTHATWRIPDQAPDTRPCTMPSAMVAFDRPFREHSVRRGNAHADSLLMKRSPHSRNPEPLSATATLSVAQLDLFPVKPIVERLAPKAVAGTGT